MTLRRPLALALLLLAGCAGMGGSTPPLHDGLPVHRAVMNSSSQAQQYFDQGLALTYAFHHDEAIRSYRHARELDPQCVMALWGIAYALGPHINNPSMSDANAQAAYETVQEALAMVGGVGPIGASEGEGRAGVERDLVRALALRYAWPQPADRAPLDHAYADAMREVWKAHPDDADVAALFAESLMDLRPWDQWSPEGEMRPETQEVLDTLAASLALKRDQPLALHLTIHAWEASPTPERAADAADLLRRRVPGAGHLVHMPSHIDVRLGHWQQAVEANQRALDADRVMEDEGAGHGMWDMYRAHNAHMLVFAAMFEGRCQLAQAKAQLLVDNLPLEAVAAMPDVLEAFLAVPDHVRVRFGLWDEILALPPQPPELPVSSATRHYARGLAFSAYGRVDEAAAELAAFDVAVGRVPATATVGRSPASSVLAVGRAMLAGELAYRRGDLEAAFASLRKAVELDDALHYDEPWDWMQPARHALGALLLEQGRVEEAEEVYRADLVHRPENGWALLGLRECLQRRGADAEAAEVDARLTKAWARADVQPAASCYCRRGPSS